MAKKIKTKSTAVKDTKKYSENKKAHPWRPCPLGKHWVITHPYHIAPSKKHPSGVVSIQHGHCRTSRSKKDHLYKDDIIEVANRYFGSLKGLPAANNLGFGTKGNKFDDLIRGWTRYWNDILQPHDPLDPDLVKALIASESGFNPNEWNHLRGKNAAYGLMQVLNASVQLLKDPRELRDHYVNLTDNDMKDPNLSICAGIRWLFRKKDLAEARTKNLVSWRDVVAAYKDVTSDDQRLMPRFDKYFKNLKAKK